MKDPTTGIEYKMMAENEDPLWFEHNVLPVFYTCMLGFGLVLPLLYLFISRLSGLITSTPSALPLQPTSPSSSAQPENTPDTSTEKPSLSSPPLPTSSPTTQPPSTPKPNTQTHHLILPLLALTTALADLSSFTLPYNLARPVYVCFYPVRGETFHHPEEARLRVQWICFLGAAAAAGCVAGWDIGGLVRMGWVRGRLGGRVKGWLEVRGGEMDRGRCEGEGMGKGEWWVFPGRRYLDLGVGDKDEDEKEMASGMQSVVLEDGEEVDIDSVLGPEFEEGEDREDEKSPDSQTPLLTPSDSEGFELQAAKVIDNTVGDQSLQEEVVLRESRDGKGTTRRYLGTVIAGLSRDRLMGLAWLLTVAAWLVMYGHSKKGPFGNWLV